MARAKLLGKRVNWMKCFYGGILCCNRFNLRMGYAECFPIAGGLPKYYILSTCNDLVCCPLYALKPDKLKLPCSVTKARHHPFFSRHSNNFFFNDLTFYLYKGHFLSNFPDSKKLRPVFVPERIVLNKIPIRMNTELFI